MASFVETFKMIDSVESLRAFVEAHGMIKDPNVKDYVLHRSQVFSIRPDGNKVLLEMYGQKPVEIGFHDDV